MTPAVKPSTLLVSLLLCLLPIAELRGGLPYALAGGVPPLAGSTQKPGPE